MNFHLPYLTPVVTENRKLTAIWLQLLTSLFGLLNQGFTGTVVTAKLTGGGTNGSIVFQNGVVVKQVAAT